MEQSNKCIHSQSNYERTGGPKSPFFNVKILVKADQITEIFNKWLDGRKFFLVDVQVKRDNKLVVHLDHPQGVKISDCVSLSKSIQQYLEIENEDCELSVSSPGAEAAFKVPQQFEKNLGRNVKCMLRNGETHTGILKEFTAKHIILTSTGSKKNKLSSIEDRLILLIDIQQINALISFKQ